MSIYKRGKIYWSKIMRHGRMFYASTGKTSRTAAADFERKLISAISASDYDRAHTILRAIFADTAQPRIPLDETWTRYESTATSLDRLNISPTSMRKRKAAVTRLLDYLNKTHPAITDLSKITPTVAAEYAQHLAAAGRTAKTRRNILGDLIAVWNVLEKLSTEIVNPWRNLFPKTIDGQRLNYFTREQESAILAAAKKIGKDWYPVCLILRHTGLRYHDVAMLRWSEITFAPDGSAVIRVTPKKTTRHHITVAIPLIREAAAALAAIRRDGRQGDYCFPGHAANYGSHKGRGGPLSHVDLLAAAGITDPLCTIHSWRHTAATRLAESGAPLDVRKRLLGHREDDTAYRYDHAEHLDEARRAIEAAARAAGDERS